MTDECDHDGTILDRPGQANPVCWRCGEVDPDVESEDNHDAEPEPEGDDEP